MAVPALPAVPAKQLPLVIRDLVPEYLEAGGYRLRLNHGRSALILQERPHDHRWVFTTFVQYSLLLLLLDRLTSAKPDFVTLEEALQVTGIWTGAITRASKRSLCKHVHHLQQDLAPWFELQVLTSGGTLHGYRLLSTARPTE